MCEWEEPWSQEANGVSDKAGARRGLTPMQHPSGVAGKSKVRATPGHQDLLIGEWVLQS
jgi:hypothetical protein